jgi:ketosteroid isomerase-like protein
LDHGNPQGYLDLYAPDVTYFDPFREKRVDGLQAMRTLFAPLGDAKPPFTNPRYEMIDPKAQRYGDLVLLTFNLVNYGKLRVNRRRCWRAGMRRKFTAESAATGESCTATGRS